jgi:putative oxidoreductase
LPGRARLPSELPTEFRAGLVLLFGRKTRVVAFVLAGFAVLSALLLHANFTDQTQLINFMKNREIAGGLGMFHGEEVAF